MTTTGPRRIDRFLDQYADDHRNAANQLIHCFCVPLIVWTVIALLWAIPVPAHLAKPGLWAALAAFLALAWSLRLSRPLALAMLVGIVVMFVFTHWLHAHLGSATLACSAVVVFVLAWIAQFIGHHLEGRRPSFLTDLGYLLIGPLWLLAKLFRRLGWRY